MHQLSGHPSAQTVDRLVWEWLPARAARARVTIPTVIAAALALPVRDITAALHRLAAAGHTIRDRPTGRRADSWHRGTPIPPPAEEPTLWP